MNTSVHSLDTQIELRCILFSLIRWFYNLIGVHLW